MRESLGEDWVGKGWGSRRDKIPGILMNFQAGPAFAGKCRHRPDMAQTNGGSAAAHFESICIARSRPSIVTGYMRLAISCRMMVIDCRYCHRPSGSGLSQMNFGN